MEEGFWAQKSDPRDRVNRMPWDPYTNLPVPQQSPVGDDVLRALEVAERQAEKTGYFGSSYCRVCDRGNGSEEYKLDGWTWPSGFKHYLTEHKVHPSAEFQNWLLTRDQ